MSAKSLWNWITNRAAAGTPANTSLFPFAPQPGTSLVAEAKHCTAADIVAAGGGGLDLGLRRITVNLTHAQILTLPTVPVQIVAGVANKFLLPIASSWDMDFHLAAYTNIQAVSLCGIGADGGATGTQNFTNDAGTGVATMTAFFGAALRQLAFVPGSWSSMVGVADLVTGATPVSWNQANLDPTQWVGMPLRVEMVNNGMNLTGGNAGNTITIQLLYWIA